MNEKIKAVTAIKTKNHTHTRDLGARSLCITNICSKIAKIMMQK